MQRSMNSFFRFVLGFTVFIGVSLGVTVVAGSFALEREKEKQAAAALEALLGSGGDSEWWEVWK